MNEFENKKGFSKCCDAPVLEEGVRSLLDVLSHSGNMWCEKCKKSILPYEINWRPEYTKISNGIYRKNEQLIKLGVC